MRLSLLLLFAAGCVSHIGPYRPKHRRYDPGEYGARQQPSGASLYAPGGRGLFEDDRAGAIGDVLVIRIDESDFASQDDSTKLERKNETELGAPASLGLLSAVKKAAPDLDPAKIFSTSSESEFAGRGQVSRRGRVSATLPVRVRSVLPNGDLFVEGSKVVMVANDERHLYLSGVVRPADIRADNSVASSRVADVEIEYTGRGDVADQQRQGWFTRLLGSIWPF